MLCSLLSPRLPRHRLGDRIQELLQVLPPEQPVVVHRIATYRSLVLFVIPGVLPVAGRSVMSGSVTLPGAYRFRPDRDCRPPESIRLSVANCPHMKRAFRAFSASWKNLFFTVVFPVRTVMRNVRVVEESVRETDTSGVSPVSRVLLQERRHASVPMVVALSTVPGPTTGPSSQTASAGSGCLQAV